MLKSLFAAIAILGFAAPALAGPGGCGSSHTAQGGSLEVAQTDQAQPLPQTPQPQQPQTTTQ